jgi:hypothetical protein
LPRCNSLILTADTLNSHAADEDDDNNSSTPLLTATPGYANDKKITKAMLIHRHWRRQKPPPPNATIIAPAAPPPPPLASPPASSSSSSSSSSSLLQRYPLLLRPPLCFLVVVVSCKFRLRSFFACFETQVEPAAPRLVKCTFLSEASFSVAKFSPKILRFQLRISRVFFFGVVKISFPNWLNYYLIFFGFSGCQNIFFN